MYIHRPLCLAVYFPNSVNDSVRVSMAQSMNRGGGRSIVGEYIVGKQIGAGSFSTVWHARHRVHGIEVAIKEIVTARLNNKLQESLKSEIVILQKINHPNIIRLHDMIEEVGKIYIVLEYCRGGDLSMYIQQHQGKIPEATAKHFMQQLASGLKILRDNNLIHRDLKPQNLLLSSNDDGSALKIADFGFARSLQPRGLAETLCGSPLYMAPEIMQLQKYDAKADLWSVGAILFQLVTGKTPFTGNNQIQLLQNILKSTELLFPSANDLSPNCTDLCKKLLRRNPVERLTFEEFFNHSFLAQKQPDELSWNRTPQRIIGGFPVSKGYPLRSTAETFQEDGLPFSLDDDSSGPDCSPSFAGRLPQRSSYGFSYDAKAERKEVSSNTPHRTDSIGTIRRLSEGNLKGSINLKDHRQATTHSKAVDSIELIDQDYVIVSGPPMDSYSSAGASRISNIPFRSSSSLQASASVDPRPSDPVPITGPPPSRIGHLESLESPSSAPGTSQRCTGIINPLEQQPTDGMARIQSLQRSASAIIELVNEKVEAGKYLEAFSIQLVILAIWKQALDICHTQAASTIEGSPKQETIRLKEIMRKDQVSLNIKEHLDPTNISGPENVCSHIEKAFLSEVGNAEELSKHIEPGNTEVPDAMEMIFRSALALGRKGAVDEYMGRTENAVVFYSKAVRLLAFLQLEAPSLILNPPFSLTNSDRDRLQNYIDVLNNRQSVSKSQMMALLKCDDPHCSP